MDIVLGTIPQEATTVPEYIAHLHDSLKKSYEHVRNQMGHHQQQQKTHHDALVQGKAFEVGDLVWLHNPAVPRGKSHKLHRPWTGPYKVVKRISETVYWLQHLQWQRRRPVVHFDCLKPCPLSIRLPRQDPPQVQGHVEPVRELSALVGSGVELLDDEVELSDPARLAANMAPQDEGAIT